MLCSQLISQLQNIQSQHQELNQKIDGFVELKNTKVSNQAKSEYLRELYQIRKELRKLIKELKKEFFNPVIETKNYITVEGESTQETEIKLNFEAILTKAIKFYRKHKIDLPPNFEARAKEIWTKNYELIQKEIATYGYDYVLIVPDNLPNLAELHAKMVEEYAETWHGRNFKDAGSFAGAKNSQSKDNSFRLVLTHNIQNLEDHSLLKATRDKSSEILTGKNNGEIESIIANQGDLLINYKLEGIRFGPDKTTSNDLLQAEGLTLAEYLIFQRQYFEITGKHLDEDGWTSLLSTFSAHLLATSAWDPNHERLSVGAAYAYYSDDDLGCRPCRSFSL